MTAMREPDRIWWSAAEIAEARLPDLPSAAQSINRLASRLKWRRSGSFARRREGKGGGWEYHWSLFPASAQRKLLVAAAPAPPPPETPRKDRGEVWEWWESLPDAVRDKALTRLRILDEVAALERNGMSSSLAVQDIARLRRVSPRTIWTWRDLVAGLRPDDRLPYLAPRHRAAERPKPKAGAVDPEFGSLLKAGYLTDSAPSFSAAYDWAVDLAAKDGVQVTPIHTMRRWFKKEVSRTTCVLAREGADALKAMYPPQQRDRTALRPLEVVNADFHRFDVFVRWPAEPGESEARIVRPQMVAFQDVYSGRMLSWRLDRTPNLRAVQLAFGDMVETWGIPDHVLLDNGREFAAKAITGGTRNRYRFKAKDDDIQGVLVALGCEVHWAQPYAAQSKPIERAFRDFCDRVARHPCFVGAYTGNSPDAKPESHGSAAVDLDVFFEVLTREIEMHNMREGRRSEVAWRRSFAAVFDEAYATAQIRKATEAQRRMLLMGAEGLTVDRRTGVLRFMGNIYHDDALHAHPGERVVVRFDPGALWDGLHVYSAEGVYLTHAACQQKVGFLDVDEAARHARARRAWIKAEKAALAAHRKLTAVELGQALADLPPVDPAAPVEARVVRPLVQKDRSGRADRPRPDPGLDAAHEALVLDMTSRRETASDVEETDLERFTRAIELEEAKAAGAALTGEQLRWLGVYQGTPEYRAHRRFYDDLGPGYLAG